MSINSYKNAFFYKNLKKFLKYLRRKIIFHLTIAQFYGIMNFVM